MVPRILTVSWSGYWQHYNLIMTRHHGHVVGKEGREIVHHVYRINVKGTFNRSCESRWWNAEKFWHPFGVSWSFRDATSLLLTRPVLCSPVWTWSWKFVSQQKKSCQNQAKFVFSECSASAVLIATRLLSMLILPLWIALVFISVQWDLSCRAFSLLSDTVIFITIR